MKAKFKVMGRFDGEREATIVIDRKTDLISVRPKRRRRTYTLPLADVAQIILERVVKAEVTEKLKRRKLAKRGFLTRRAA